MSFVAIEPRTLDGSAVNLAEFDSTSHPIVIWRLILSSQTHTFQHALDPSSTRSVSSTLLSQSLDSLFPQLSSSAKSGPSLARIEACLATPQTFSLFLATATNAQGDITTIQGCLTLITLTLLMNSRAHIEDLVVSTECRGQGVGRALMQRALHEAVQTHNCSMVDLTSKPDRIQARKLYESLGFQIRDTGAFRYYAKTS
ncbi:MAG: acyl-CoA N-acyltransferase [Podila humilis]|nr:MAG: acyl-CoA N-acyltransferase [Podila humilis]